MNRIKTLHEPHRTAIRRVAISAPTRWLEDQELLSGRILDYGCGYGKDAAELGFEVYDPYFFPNMPRGKFDTILCNYVLNVVPEREQAWIIHDIETRLSPEGVAYLTVRRDLKGHEKTQRIVRLQLPVVVETPGFCIYETGK